MIEQKSIGTSDKFLGQFMTPSFITDDILNNIKNIKYDSIFIEPSFGTGNFIKSFLKHNIPASQIIGIEIDDNLFNKFDLNINSTLNINYYDFNIESTSYLHFIGNVPFRTPAVSLRTHPLEIKRLCKKYRVSGIREEAVFFILKTLELIENSNKGGRISFIIPKNILTNNSKFFKTFHQILHEKFKVLQIIDLPNNIFDGASLDTCLLDIEYSTETISSFLGIQTDYWKFNEIFKNTYLGSVPCESIFLSCPVETQIEFKNRLIKLFLEYPNNLFKNLKHNDMAHLKVLNSNNTVLINKKIEIISSYMLEILEKHPNILEYLNDDSFYKKINHRHTSRFYFRCKFLKKMSFVYEINPNPCKSFYFTGNPSSTSTDYFGYCDYDITRNSSPGACRTIPIDGLSDNLTSEFKLWWDDNIAEDYNRIFDVFLYVHKSNWYREMKKKYKRFYFGIPKDVTFLKSIP
jgi:hypothetical protein